MSNHTYIKLTGWVTKDPELRKTNADNTSVCTIRMGTANRWLDKASGDWRDGPPSYFDVVCWRNLAENVAASLRKGHMITIHGSFRNRAWTDKDENPRTTLEITAYSVGHELMFGWSHYNRTYRPSSPGQERLAEGEVGRGLDANGQADQEVPAAGPALEPAGERVSGVGDEGNDAGAAEAAVGEPRLEEVAVPV